MMKSLLFTCLLTITVQFQAGSFREIVDNIPAECGWIKEGNEEDIQFPWMVNILQRDPLDNPDNFSYLCTATLLHPQVVVTTAHCISGKNVSNLKIQVASSQQLFVKEMIIHEKFDIQTLSNDIALVVFDSLVRLGPNTALMCVSASQQDFDAARCFAPKRNRLSEGQITLKKLELPLVSNEQCQEALRTTKLGSSFLLHNSSICAGGKKDRDTCTEDSGSPLVCPLLGDSKRYTQVGIVAWGVGCGTEGLPGIYTNVPHFASWIQDHISKF